MNAPTPSAALAIARRPTSNAEFLPAIFGAPGTARPRVCCVIGNPKDPGKRLEWDGWPWSPGAACDAEGLNWYFTMATHVPDASGRYTRKRAQFAAIHGAMLDDVGTKGGPLSALRLPPSVVIETSPGNHQVLYLYREPVTDLAAAEALQEALIAAGLCDPDADGPSARYGRLPFGINGKHSPPFACRLIEWHPERRYTLAQIMTGLQLSPAPARVRKAAAPSHDKWNALDDVGRERLTTDLRSALAVIPSDDRATWVKNGHRLKADLPEEVGLPLWEEWSRKAATFTEEGLDQWETFDPDQTGHAAVFSDAQALGWRNPSARVEVDPSSIAWGGPLPPGATPITPAQIEALMRPTVPAVPPTPSIHVPRFALLTGADLCNMPPAAWRIKGVLPAEGLAVVYGAPGSGKSFLVFDAATAIAAGAGHWFGHRVKPAAVVYGALEGQAGLRNRAAAWVAHHGRPLPAGLQFMVQPFDVTNPADVAALGACVPPGAVSIIDTLNRAALGRDENSPADMGLMLQGASSLQAATGGLVLLVHHSGKDATRGMRGHSSLHGAADTAIEVERAAPGSPRREWKVAKQKDGSDGEANAFELRSVDLGRDDDDDPLSSCIVVSGDDVATAPRPPKLSDGARTAVTALLAAGATAMSGVHLDTWRAAFNAASTADNAEAKKKAFKRARDALHEAGVISVRDDIYRMAGDFGSLQAGGQTGTPGGHVPPRPPAVGDRQGHTPIGVSRVPLPASHSNLSGK